MMEEKEKLPKSKKLTALKDFRCFFDGKTYEFKKGCEVKAPKELLVNLKTEKVI